MPLSVDPDSGWMGKALMGMVAALTAVVSWAWSHTHSRIKDLDMKTDRKADAVEVERHRESIAKLFDKLDELDHKTEERFTQSDTRSSDRHIELLKAIHAVGSKQ